jgi:hypothetical protein
MEPIVLVGAIIVMFGLWQELEPVTQRIVTAISNRLYYAKFNLSTYRPAPILSSRYMAGAQKTAK